LESKILKGLSFYNQDGRDVIITQFINKPARQYHNMKEKGLFATVDEYIALQPVTHRAGLELLRKTIKKAAPGAEETISYQMPAYRLHGMLVFFSATNTHYGFYPTSSPMVPFREKLKPYSTSKGAIRFPFDKPIPVKLVTEIVKWKVKDNLAKEKVKNKK
jgi:uncharacterized protein YdhG (YjbR/CyaY superfamily)